MNYLQIQLSNYFTIPVLLPTIRPILSDPLHLLSPLTIGLSRIITVLDYQILWPIVVSSGEVRVENILRTFCITLLRIDRRTGHVRNHGVASAEGVLCVAEWVILGCRLWEPDIAPVAAEMAALESFCYVFLHDDSTAGGIDEP